MKKFLSLKNIAIIALVALVAVKWLSPSEKVYVEGKPYEVIKNTTDTVTVVDTKVVFKKGKTVYEKVIVEKKIEVPTPVLVDTMSILKGYYSKVSYNDTLRLPDSLGTVSILGTITQNKILDRTFNASIKQRTIKDTVNVKELPKTKIYYGPEGGFNHTNLVSHLGIGVLVKTKKDRIYNLGVGYSSQVVGSKLQSWTPYISTGIFWRVK
jgi:hypothetical protein